MLKLHQKLGTAVAIAAAIGGTLTPFAFADTTVKVSDNGNKSTNKVTVNKGSSSSVKQTNNTAVFSGIAVKSNTGKNKTNNNTGNGGTTSATGNSKVTAGVIVSGSSNTATNPDCGCPEGNTKVKVTGNGNESTNKVTVNEEHSTSVNQSNTTIVGTLIGVDSNTGNNQTNNNTGQGGTSSSTGNSNVTAGVVVSGSQNTLN